MQHMAVSLVAIALWGQALSPGCHSMFTQAQPSSEKQARGSLPHDTCGWVILKNPSIQFLLKLGVLTYWGGFSDSGVVDYPIETLCQSNNRNCFFTWTP